MSTAEMQALRGRTEHARIIGEVAGALFSAYPDEIELFRLELRDLILRFHRRLLDEGSHHGGAAMALSMIVLARCAGAQLAGYVMALDHPKMIKEPMGRKRYHEGMLWCNYLKYILARTYREVLPDQNPVVNSSPTTGGVQ